MTPVKKRVALTGDRPTGPLHVGHYVGSLRSRLALQDETRQYVMIADAQAATDNADDMAKVRRNVVEVAVDYLAVGLDPRRTTILVQSAVPELYELTCLYMNLVAVPRLERNPTVRAEVEARRFEGGVPAGFLCYPVSQAADITAFKAEVVPVGADQAPMVELANEVAARVNRRAGRDLLPSCKASYAAVSRLPGADGSAKMSKSLGNALPLSAGEREVTAYVRSMYTDPGHLRVDDPGTVEGNVVFSFLEAFDEADSVAELKARYRAGGLGDGVLKARLGDLMNAELRPVRERRAAIAADPRAVVEMLREGTARAREVAAAIGREEVREALGLFTFG